MSRNCSFNPPCRSHAEMVYRHGSLERFQRSVETALADGLCTIEEAQAAVAEYRLALYEGRCQ